MDDAVAQPPVREPIDFDATHVAVGIAGGYFLTVRGTQPDAWTIALEDDDMPTIPEPEWVRWLLVGYHFGEYQPSPQPFSATREIRELPPGARGIEIVGKTMTEQIPIESA